MDNEKDLDAKTAKNAENTPAEEKNENAAADDALQKELSELASLFEEELKKAKKEAEERENEEELPPIQELEPVEECEEKEEEIPEEERCLCCGERRRDKSISENYEYCAECREAMKKFPIGIQHFITAAVIVICAVMAITLFTKDYSAYKNVSLAKKSDADGKKTSAIEYYDNAISYFDKNSTQCKTLNLKSAEDIYNTLPSGAKSLSEAASRIEDSLTSFEVKLPMYKKYVKMRDSAVVMYGTLQEFYNIMGDEKYAGFDGTDENLYSQLMSELDALIGKTFEINEIKNSGNGVEKEYDEGIVRFSQYMLAYSCKKDGDAYKYISLMEKAKPEYICLYGYELSVGEIKNGNFDKALNLSKEMLKNNAEDTSAYVVKSYVARLKGDFDGSLKEADAGLELDETNADLYRQKAMAYILKGDFDGALEKAEKGLSYSEYGAMYYVYLVAATEKGDSALVKTAKEKIEALGIGYTERMSEYLSGKLSSKQLFTEGTGDVE